MAPPLIAGTLFTDSQNVEKVNLSCIAKRLCWAI
jgi:hypothetical protein